MDTPSAPSGLPSKEINQLYEKYSEDNQQIKNYLEGLYQSDYLKYWDYVHLDTLLSLQTPKTVLPDEVVFLAYHQISELYFKLVLHELEQVSKAVDMSASEFSEKLSRINRYVDLLVQSFSIVSAGIDHQQFMNFRQALYPASGFQSYQFRLIELYCSDIANLIERELRDSLTKDISVEEAFPFLYWKKGAINAQTGAKTITLSQFEEKYDNKLLKKAKKVRKHNLWRVFVKHYSELPEAYEIVEKMRELDVNLNINWRLVHFKSAVKHFKNNSDPVNSTGGTNWHKYLPPKFQRIVFFPDLWSYEELGDWGKSWVMNQFNILPTKEGSQGLLVRGDYY
jgi:tryptophan 2,3-dioxygenase